MREVVIKSELQIEAECAIADSRGEVLCDYRVPEVGVIIAYFGQPNEVNIKRLNGLEKALAKFVIDSGKKAGVEFSDGKIIRTK